jgi:hypothetical protein
VKVIAVLGREVGPREHLTHRVEIRSREAVGLHVGEEIAGQHVGVDRELLIEVADTPKDRSLGCR